MHDMNARIVEEISYEDLASAQDQTCTGEIGFIIVGFYRTPDGQVWKIWEGYDSDSALRVAAEVTKMDGWICEADPDCRECGGWCSQASVVREIRVL